ncbi:MAG: selenocysteine-specific translation elongation factor [Myxococcota bacterium]|nr:selenocysteine-specific translation elongation factor [Myxococcota bacterium]
MLIATAGHVDHGKTTLVQALTGVDCDTLAEEKARGITIHLGFARWTLSDGHHISVIDVPGHEALIRTMANGVGYLDSVLLVIDGRCGVMPQTREHLNICRLLGVEHGVIAMTFADQCDDIASAAHAIRTALADDLASSFPLIPVSAPTGQGLDELEAVMKQRLIEVSSESNHAERPALMPIDRIFHRPGFGTIVTGTLIEGRVRVNETLMLMPDDREVKIRALEVHGENKDIAVGKTRLAINLRQSGRPMAAGDWLMSKPIVSTVKVFDASIHWLSHAGEGLHRRRGLALQAGLNRALADIRVDGMIQPGETGTARVRLDRPIPVTPTARFILRDQRVPGFGTVIGGGVILDTKPPRRRSADIRHALFTRPEERAAILIQEAGAQGITTASLMSRVKHFSSGARHHFDAELLETAQAQLRNVIDDHHRAHPTSRGLPKTGLLSTPISREALRLSLQSGQLRQAGSMIGSAQHAPIIDPAVQRAGQKLMRAIGRAGFVALSHDDLLKRFPASPALIQQALHHLVKGGKVDKIEAFYFPVRELHQARALVAAHVTKGERLPVGWLKKNLGMSRKYAIPIWHWLDKLGVTCRDGHERTAGPRAEAYLND